MPEIMPDDRPFYWACGKCRGAGLYRDDDRLVGDFSIVCPICGNRYYGDVGGRVRGLAPVITYYTIESAPLPAGASHFILERTANIVTGPARSGARTIKKEEESMTAQPRKRPCKNCNRELTIVSDGCCYVCYHAGKGLEGEEKAAALAAVKARIESGGLKSRGGGRRGPRPKGRIAPADPAAAPTRRKAFRQMIGDDDIAAAQRLPKGFARVPEGGPMIAIDFAEERDRKIYDALIEQAARQRRTPEAQILWMLQNAMEQETGLLAEASGR